ncbi:oligosaccharide flippase family protein [Candidatus Bathycorpusculum sp.]|uniref:oligosaccharide flippase family protein n=1 Tax=Candidatus Bathycorpusculum sp. TaxID=2994959 RepID=UPI0028190FFD|nr:oligosaccharide flippase family protein [Candidatus Termitimicrobium sp.]MCL2685484.1 oligosaccharide flippase family protein [Candidatus Termitimicrobium sp.]
MSKAADMAKVSAKGGFHMLWGLVISTVISSVGTIIIGRLLGADNWGLYTIAIAAPTMIATFRDWGVNTAMVRYTAQYNSENQVSKIRSVFVAGLIFELVLGLALSIASIALSGFLANAYQRPEIVHLIQIASIFVLSGAMMSAAGAAFTGMERLHLNSIMLIVQSIVKTGLILALVILGFGTLGAITGFSIAVLVAGITGVLLMYLMYTSLPKPEDGKLAIGATIKTLLGYGLPLSIGTMLVSLLGFFYSLIMPIFVIDNSIIGNYSLAQTFVVLITFFASPVTTMLFPAFSKLDYRTNSADLKNVFQYSVKYAALIVVPVTFLVMSLAEPAIHTLFPEGFSQAPFFLMLLSISYLLTAFGNLSAANLINSQGDTKYSLKLSILQTAIGFPLGFVLISQFGIIGLIISSLTVVLPGLVLSLNFIKKRYGVSVAWGASAKILISSALTGVLTYLLVTWLPFISVIRLAIGVVAFVGIFILIAVFTRTITRTDLENIRTIVGGLGPLRKPLNIVLGILEKLMPKA